MLNSSSRDMTEIAKMIDDIVGTMESWSGALNALEETSEIHKELVNDYSMVREDAIPETVLDAAARCASSGAKLATAEEIREVGTKQHVRMAKRDWDKVKGRYERFRNNVRLLHDLAQQLLAKRLIETTSSIESLIERQTQFHALHDRGSVCNRVFDMNSDSAGANYQPDMDRVLGESTFMHDALQYQTARHCKTDWRPSISRASSFTIDQLSISTSQLSGGTAYRYSSVSIDPSITDSTITVIHEDKPRYIAARAKYDTGSDVNFTSSAFVVENGLSPLLEELDHSEIFVGLNDQEYHVKHTVVLHWCAATMHKARTTTFFVADEVPYDILLGNEFIIRNRVFEPQRTVLALRYKHRSAAQREEEERRNRDHEMLATLEQQRTRAEDALKRAQEREAKKKAKLQTSASSMCSSDTSADSKTDGSTTPDSTVGTLVKIGSFRCQMTNLPIGNSVNGD
ncbi:hypothetical protein KCU99_g5701, partial [Aureobasidium melanogenum]